VKPWLHRLLAAFLAASPLAIAAGDAVKDASPNGHKLVQVPAGTYSLGEAGHKTNHPHAFKTAGFRIADCETTNAQFARFVAATGYVTNAEKNGWSNVAGEGSAEWEWTHMDGANWRHPFGPQGPDAGKEPDHPVTQISGEDARAYCRWIGGRLPTLDEWETAARAGSKTRYPWGATYDVHAANTWNGVSHLKNTREDGYVLTAPVGSYPANAWGLHDVIGNVFEYCEGHPAWMTSDDMARKICARGGSWWCSDRCCNFHNLLDIGAMFKTASLPNQGFRVAFDLPDGNKPPPQAK